jgi:uncharacterized protein
MRLAVDLAGVLETLGNTITISGAVELDGVDLGAQHFSFAGPATFTVTIANGGAGNVVAAGSVEVTARATCVRCLREFDLPVTAAVEAFYVLPGHEDEIPDEQDHEVIVENRIDLYGALEQAVVVELPYAPVHDEACAGICPVCGCDRNEVACSCDTAPGTSPFAALQGLLPGEEKDSGER